MNNKYVRLDEVRHAVLHNEGQAVIAAIDDLKTFEPHGIMREMLVDEMIDRENRPQTNAELIKALRCCIVDFNSTQSRRCNECPYRIYADVEKACENKAKRDAADALEAADKRIAELSLDCEMYQQKCMEMGAQMPTGDNPSPV